MCSFLCREHACWICSQAAASWASRLCPAVPKAASLWTACRGIGRCEGQLQNGRGGPPEDIRQGEAESFLANIRGPFDLALLDPPFHHDTVAAVLPLLAAKDGPRRGGPLRDRARGRPARAGGRLTLVKQYNYGKIKVSRCERGEEV